MPEDAEFVLKNTANCHGFYGASSMERLPTEGCADGIGAGPAHSRRIS
jgi:predicted TIM-barrel enzyme